MLVFNSKKFFLVNY